MSEDQKKEVEVVEVTQPEPTAFATKGLLPEEVEMAKEHGLIKDEEDNRTKDDGSESSEKDKDEHTEQPEPETEEDTGQEETEDKDTEGEEQGEVKPGFEDVEKDENQLKQYNPNEQALYWKWKSDKKKRQAAQREAEEIKAKLELNQVRDSAANIKLKKIAAALNGDNLTVEALQSIIGDAAEQTDTPLTKSDLDKIEAEKEEKRKEEESVNKRYRDRIETAENIGKAKYKNFEELTALAKEVVDKDKTYKKVLEESFTDPEVEEEELVERVVTFAKMNPKFGKKKSEDTETVDRAIKNSKKKISSASVGHGGGKRTVSYDDLTVEDAARLTTDQWIKLPEEVRTRLLMQ